MELVAALARVVPVAAAAGINLYATVAVLGLSLRYDLVDLPDQFRPFEHPIVIGVALVLFVAEFVADKIPWFDTLWDAVHTAVRPLGGALVAVIALGGTTPGVDALAALLGGSVALTTHATKAGTRALANTSPEPFSNWGLSLIEDVVAVALTYLALQYPYVALAIAVALLAAVVLFASVLIRAVRRRLAGWSGAVVPTSRGGQTTA